MSKYCVIAEHKLEKPIVYESGPLDHDKARIRMMELSMSPNIIRVAMAKLVYAEGNETLIEGETEND